MVEEFLEEISTGEDWAPPKGSAVEKLNACLPIPDEEIDYKETLTKELQKKYGYDPEDSD